VLYKLAIRPLATLEIIDAYDWYESQKSGLGNQFILSLDEFYKKLLINPYIHSIYDDTIRAGSLSKFPYKIIYEVFDIKIVVYSVFMVKQSPTRIRTF